MPDGLGLPGELQASILLGFTVMSLTECPSLSTQCVAELTLHLREACRMRAFQENILEKVTTSMARVFPGGNIPHFCSFIPVHPAFSRAQQFLDDLFAR